MSFLILLREQHLCSALPEYLVPLSTGCGGGHLKGVLYDGDKYTLILKPMHNKWPIWKNLMGEK
jgi:hypothetical protein